MIMYSEWVRTGEEEITGVVTAHFKVLSWHRLGNLEKPQP